MVLAEHQVVADTAHALALAQQREVPGAIDRVAVQAGAHELVVADHELLVDAADRVRQRDLLGVGAAREVAGREEVDTGDLELRRRDRTRVHADAELREMRRAHARHLEQRRDEAVGAAAMVDALADRVDARVVGLHRVVDEDAARPLRAAQAGGLCERGVGTDADGHHDQVRGHFAAVLELHGPHAAVVVADQLGGLGLEQEPEAAILERLLQHLGRDLVELALHQPRHDVDHRHVHAAQLETVGGLEAEQAAADHDRVLVDGRRVDHAVRVGDVAIAQHALQVLAGHRQDEGIGAGREQQPVVAGRRPVGGDDQAPHPVDLRDGLVEMQRDAVLGIPLHLVQHDLFDRLLARQHRRQQDAVVVGVRLGTEDRDVVEVGGDLEQFLDRPHAGHAVADQHELLSFAPPSRDPRRSCLRPYRPCPPLL